MSIRKLVPGQAVRVEHDARVLGLAFADNPYWYVVEYPSGQRETVSLSRLSAIADTSKNVIDTDCSIQIFSPKLSPAGALDLLTWLRTHEHEFREVTQAPHDAAAAGNESE